uniref:Uncharacterized protein n=1 Tax=Lepeophtheirus salmonis TaxID=72036 RepID=A0A0K2U018_LEPSM
MFLILLIAEQLGPMYCFDLAWLSNAIAPSVVTALIVLTHTYLRGVFFFISLFFF